MSVEYYEVAYHIAEKMKNFGYEEWSDKIIDAIESSSIGTEILMSVRWYLKKFINEEKECCCELKNEISHFLISLDKVLT